MVAGVAVTESDREGAGTGAEATGCVTDGEAATTGVERFTDDDAGTDAGAGDGVLRGVGNSIGVTATTTAVKSSAIRSFLSIYGTGS
jgi:hypothetical protein